MQRSTDSYLRIKIKTIDSNIHDIVFDVNNPSVKELKKKIEFKLKIPISKQRLIYQGRVLQENLNILDYKIENDYVIHLVEQQEFPQTNQNENSTTSSLFDSFNGRANFQSSTFGDIFNMMMQTRRDVNSGNFNRANSLNSRLNNYSNNIPNTMGEGMDNNSNNNLINFPEFGLGGLASNLLNLSNLRSNSNPLLSSLPDPFDLNLSELEGFFIPDSFKSLVKRTSFNKVEFVEVIKQNINNIKELIKNIPNLNYDYYNTIKNIFTTNETNMNSTLDFKVGQWIDAKDSLEQWCEAQIMDVKDKRVFIHFFGWGNSFNEWINYDSNRLALFRSYTLQSPFTKYYSAFPNKKDDGGLIITNVKDFDNFENLHDLVNFLDKLREKIMKVIFEREAYNLKIMKKSKAENKTDIDNNYGNNYRNLLGEEETNKFEKINFFSMSQLIPLMDRIGRIFTDFSNYLFHYCFNKFENDYEKFKSNIGNEERRYNLSNYSSTQPDRILNKKINSYYNITQVLLIINYSF